MSHKIIHPVHENLQHEIIAKLQIPAERAGTMFISRSTKMFYDNFKIKTQVFQLEILSNEQQKDFIFEQLFQHLILIELISLEDLITLTQYEINITTAD